MADVGGRDVHSKSPNFSASANPPASRDGTPASICAPAAAMPNPLHARALASPPARSSHHRRMSPAVSRRCGTACRRLQVDAPRRLRCVCHASRAGAADQTAPAESPDPGPPRCSSRRAPSSSSPTGPVSPPSSPSRTRLEKGARPARRGRLAGGCLRCCTRSQRDTRTPARPSPQCRCGSVTALEPGDAAG